MEAPPVPFWKDLQTAQAALSGDEMATREQRTSSAVHNVLAVNVLRPPDRAVM